MEEPRASVVEVTSIVPIEDVPYVAARVAERLGMPVDRVRKLIENRTGPITRPLRPDKADAIAQTFEAAGVSVVIRPATEDDDAGAAAPASSTDSRDRASDGSAHASSDSAPSTVAEDDGASDAEPEPELEAAAEPVPDHEPEPEPAPKLEPELEPAPEHEPELEPEPEPESELEPEPQLDIEPEPEPDDGSDVDELAAPSLEEHHGVVMDVEDPERATGSDDAVASPDRGRQDHDPDPDPDFDPDPDTARTGGLPPGQDDELDELDETNDPGPFGLEARGEVRLNVDRDPAFDEASTAVPGGLDRPSVGARDVPTQPVSGGPAVLADPPLDEPVIGRSAPGTGDASPFGDPETWGGDDPSGGWIIGTRKARRFEVLHDDEPVSELASDADGAAGAGDEAAASGDRGAQGHDDGAEGTAPWRDAAGIGRASRRPRFGAPPRLGRVEVDAPDASRHPEAHDDPDHAVAPPATDASADDAPHDASAGSDVGDAERDEATIEPIVVDASEAPPVPRAPVRAPGVVPVPRPGARADAGVPTAWRGLGGDAQGPARPADAQLPQRGTEGYDERVQRVAAERATRRRTVMLVALAVALGLFVVAQVWVAGRAAPAFDAGLHRFRDADFGAAQRVWTHLASDGDANAQFMLGYLSEAGLGRPWSARAAASWYRLAADAGHAEAQWRLGLLYEAGLGVPHEPANALRWWAAAAEGGHGEAAFRLARARLEGVAGVSDVDAALDAFVRAADLGWPAAPPYRDALTAASSGRPHPGALP